MEVHNRIPGTHTVLELIGVYEGQNKDGEFAAKPHYKMGPSRPPQKWDTPVRHVDPDEARKVALSTGRLGLGLGSGA